MSIKKATNLDEQVEILRERGMIILYEDKAKEVLLDIGYFRLGFYCFPFESNYPNKENRTHKYVKGVKFEDIINLYYFDCDLRNILIKYITRIEINFRTFLTYTVSNKYKDYPRWFADKKIVNKKYANDFYSKVYKGNLRNTPIIERHHKKHKGDRFAPAWKTIEFMTFGSILVLYNNLQSDEIKRKIANQYGIRKVDLFIDYMNIIKIIRNTCAHSGVLFDIKLPKAISSKVVKVPQKHKQNLTGAILVIKHILRTISINRLQDMEKEIADLVKKVPNESIIKPIIESNLQLNIQTTQ